MNDQKLPGGLSYKETKKFVYFGVGVGLLATGYFALNSEWSMTSVMLMSTFLMYALGQTLNNEPTN